MHYALVKNLMRTSKRDLCLSAFTMHRHHHLTFAALLVFMVIKTTSAVGQPFTKCRAFHNCSLIPAV